MIQSTGISATSALSKTGHKETNLIFAHIMGEPLFDAAHHLIVFGAGFGAGIVFAAAMIVRRKAQ